MTSPGTTHSFTMSQIAQYQKLVLPSSLSSKYWKYFGFPADENGTMLMKHRIVCTLCRHQISYNKNTSNLKNHLKSRHSEELQQLEAEYADNEAGYNSNHGSSIRLPELQQVSIQSTNSDREIQHNSEVEIISVSGGTTLGNMTPPVLHSSSVTIEVEPAKIPCRVVEASILPDEGMHRTAARSALTQAIARFFIQDLIPVEFMEGSGFQTFLSFLYPHAEVPTKDALCEEINSALYEDMRNELYSVLSYGGKHASISIERWKSIEDKSFVTVTINYIQDYTMIESKILNTHEIFSSWKTEDYAQMLEDIFEEWGINPNNIKAAVGPLMEPLKRGFAQKGIISFPCLVHSLQISIEKSFKLPDVHCVIEKCRKLVSFIRHSPGAITSLCIQQQTESGSDEHLLLGDHPSLWITTYDMLQRIQELQKPLSTILEALPSKNKCEFHLNTDDWHIVNDILRVLQPLTVTINTISSEKILLVSLVQPLLSQLVNVHLKVSNQASATANAMNDIISTTLQQQYSDSGIKTFLHTATMLDPRFKSMAYATEQEKTSIGDAIKHLIVTAMKNKKEDDKDNEISDEIPPKRSRTSGIEFLLGDLCVTKGGMTLEERSTMELIQYRAESCASLEECPLTWWRKMEPKCPHLAQLALSYQCVPATAIPSSRIPSAAQLLFQKKRSCLSSETAGQLLFLNSNCSLKM